MSGDLGEWRSIPSWCGEQVPMYGYGGSVLFRPRQWLVLEGTTRTIRGGEVDCAGVGYAPPVQPDGTIDSADSTFDNIGRRLTASELRVGFETPASMPLVRVSAGAGALWWSRALPLGSVAVGMGTRGAGTRFYAELETEFTRNRGTATHSIFRLDSLGDQHLIRTFSVPITKSIRWSTLHLGFEIPLAGKAAAPDSSR